MLSLLLGAGVAGAAVIRAPGCDFQMQAAGPHQGPVGQLSSGQARFGDMAPATFRIDQGRIWDAKGNGCWWTPPTGVLQCDKNQDAAPGFSVGCDGAVSFNGQTTFYQCATGDGNQWNIYLYADQGMDCGQVSLAAGGCRAQCEPSPAPSPAPAPAPAPAPPAPSPRECPASLDGPYEFPHLIVPVDKSRPDDAPGTSYFGTVSPTVSSLFNFDIPAADQGKTCTLVFLFPTQSQLTTSSYTFSGDGSVDFSMLDGPASQGTTTWNNQPGKKTDYGSVAVAPGHSYSVATFPCPAGQTVAFKMEGCGDTDLRYFQDYNPSPIGLYITKC
ncbi:uncharacterized protein UV8b_07152 [Ustilaginoidea virens]|uniref:GPI anchored cell wall protein n=1 Tax=Ustilaginoidea virens TaxID=1159556 RepID=A0A8E5MKI4_USTVR|nr:uncharacterized protein UV8b_07152 [Ustilaginoidea virens]QUC22911.1 hypothetical protein UV8b_07152 [Ustilaginoidea virens]